MSRVHVQFRLPESLYPHVLAFKAEHGLNDTGAMVKMIEAFFGVGNHAQFSLPLPTEHDLLEMERIKGDWFQEGSE